MIIIEIFERGCAAIFARSAARPTLRFGVCGLVATGWEQRLSAL
jgi:hypothetical protein